MVPRGITVLENRTVNKVNHSGQAGEPYRGCYPQLLPSTCPDIGALRSAVLFMDGFLSRAQRRVPWCKLMVSCGAVGSRVGFLELRLWRLSRLVPDRLEGTAGANAPAVPSGLCTQEGGELNVSWFSNLDGKYRGAWFEVVVDGCLTVKLSR